MARPQDCITVQEAKTLHANWINTRATVLKSALGYDDVRDVVFDLDDLQEFITYVKDLSDDQGITSPGIRIYFSAKNTLSDNKATVFLAPTNGTASGSPNNYNIDPYNRGTNGWPPNAY